MSITQIYKKQDNTKRMATPNDEVYLYPMRLFCHLCKGCNGPTKVRQNLWQLAYHYKTCHNLECREEWQDFICNLEKLIKWRIIK